MKCSRMKSKLRLMYLLEYDFKSKINVCVGMASCFEYILLFTECRNDRVQKTLKLVFEGSGMVPSLKHETPRR